MNSYHLVFLLQFPIVVLVSCGYSSEPLYRYDTQKNTVAVPVFENRTKWRELEQDVTGDVVEKITSRTPYRIANYDEADLIIRGEITDFSRPVLSEDELDSVVRSSVKYQVTVQIMRRESEEVIQRASRSFSASFSGARGKDEEAAKQEAQERVGAWVVRLLERNQW